MDTKSTSIPFILSFVLVTFITLLPISVLHSDDSDDDRYHHRGMGHMGMGSGHMGMGSGHMGMGHMRMGMHANVMHALDLSDQQRKKVRKIYRSSRTQQLTLQDKISDHADKLYSLYKKDKPNAKEISSVYKDIFDLKRKKIELSITIQNEVYDVLTTEQKEQLKKLKSSGKGYKRKYRMHHMME